MHHEHAGWFSPALQREMHLEVIGHGGARMLVFPTSMGTRFEWIDRSMHEVLRDHIEQGWLQMYFVDQVTDESWYNETMHPGAQAWRHPQYLSYLADEVLPFSQSRNGTPFVIATGASFGAFHAASLAFKYPHLVHRLIGLSGMYDIRRFTGGYTDSTVYACNPMEFMANESDPARLDAFRRQDIIFAIGTDDPMIENNRRFSGLLWEKGIGNALREWHGFAHDWPWWEKMVRIYVGGHD